MFQAFTHKSFLVDKYSVVIVDNTWNIINRYFIITFTQRFINIYFKCKQIVSLFTCIFNINLVHNLSMQKHLLSIIVAAAFVLGFALQTSAAQITVKRGDSMWLIAKRYNVSFTEVLRLNKHYDNQHLIYPGEKIYIPDGSHGTHTATNSESDTFAKGNATAIQTDIPSKAENILLLVNAERKKQGLKELTLSNNISHIANLKAQDMAQNNYFSHTSPSYGSPFEMLQHFGVSYKSAGENIAAGQRSAEEVMQSWLNSSGHRANILNPSYTELGVGYAAGGSYKTYWVQLFLKP